jgi:hypothetical protein
MKTRILNTLSLCAVLLVCAASFAYAAPQCSIVQSSIPWDQSNQSTWTSGVYQLTIECTDNGSPVVGYQAKFSISLMEGANWENKIGTLTTYSTPTDSAGIAYINVPLLQIKKTDGKYIHICPFDDIQCTGGGSLSSQTAPANSSMVAPLANSNTGCTNTNTISGCCQTTITVTCCTPNISFTYCTTTTAENCIAGTTHPDPCTTITTTWSPSGICNYCSGQCGTTVIALSSFTAKPGNGSITLNWATETEIDNAGFNIYRAESADGNFIKINSSLISAKGSSTQGASYEFADTSVQNRKIYYYKLEDIDLNGTSTMHGPVNATPRLIYGIGK